MLTRVLFALFIIFASINLIAAAAPARSAQSSQLETVSAPPTGNVPIISSISGCAQQFHNFSINCYSGYTLTLFIENFAWIEWVSIASTYNCTNIKPVNASAITCTLPYVANQYYGRILTVQASDQFTGVGPLYYGIEYGSNNNNNAPVVNKQEEEMKANPVKRVSAPRPTRSSEVAPAAGRPIAPYPSINSVWGCGQQFKNFSIGCSWSSQLTIFIDNYVWIEWVSIGTGAYTYNCTNIKPVNDSAITCTAPNVNNQDYGRILPVQASDQFGGVGPLFYGIEYGNNVAMVAQQEAAMRSNPEKFAADQESSSLKSHQPQLNRPVLNNNRAARLTENSPRSPRSAVNPRYQKN